jgi:hypothetical protein
MIEWIALNPHWFLIVDGVVLLAVVAWRKWRKTKQAK